MTTAPEPIRTLIVDDSRIFRGVLEQAFSNLPETVVVGSVFNGEKALEFIRNHRVDFATLDIEMPGLSGLDTLKQIRQWNQGRPLDQRTECVLISSLTKQGAACTVEGLQLGALDFILKPSGADEDSNRAVLEKALREKLVVFRAKRNGQPLGPRASSAAAPSAIRNTQPNTSTPAVPRNGYQAVAIGISTGGPEALSCVLPQLAGKTTLPIFIVQHNLQGLSGYMADSLGKRSNVQVVETQDEMKVSAGGVYLAKSGSHSILRLTGSGIVIGQSDAPPENHSRPSVDVFFRSAACIYGTSLIAIVMTGMLNDGANGIRAVKRSGGYTLAQDEATSVVWGMPRAAIETGCVDQVVPLDRVASSILDRIALAQQKPSRVV
jgi:two-component system, chemotaxis family, protein-glutamate methylesterase/glutaminase